jgi:hypothetical protein
MTLYTAKTIRQVAIAALLFGFLVTVAKADSCQAWTKCPIDGAQANKVDTEYQGIVAIGVYEHTTTTGQTHRFRMRCN